MALEIPADLAVGVGGASLGAATSKPALCLGERPGLFGVRRLEGLVRVLGPGEIVWVPIWVSALNWSCALAPMFNLSGSLFCHLSKGNNEVVVRI